MAGQLGDERVTERNKQAENDESCKEGMSSAAALEFPWVKGMMVYIAPRRSQSLP